MWNIDSIECLLIAFYGVRSILACIRTSDEREVAEEEFVCRTDMHSFSSIHSKLAEEKPLSRETESSWDEPGPSWRGFSSVPVPPGTPSPSEVTKPQNQIEISVPTAQYGYGNRNWRRMLRFIRARRPWRRGRCHCTSCRLFGSRIKAEYIWILLWSIGINSLPLLSNLGYFL